MKMNRFDYENPMMEIVLLSEDVVRTSDVKFGDDENAGTPYF